MIQVSGYAAQQAKTPLAPYSFARREPRDYDILIDIQYCGICHTAQISSTIENYRKMCFLKTVQLHFIRIAVQHLKTLIKPHYRHIN